MNFSEFDCSDALKNQLNAMEKSRRMPHAILVTGGSESTRRELSTLLSSWAVCVSEGEKPCMECSGCRKSVSKNHVDIYYAKGTGKTDGIAVEEIRRITKDTALSPNEAPRKVYVLFDADKRMGKESMNAFLKTLEEPSQDILFILTAENVKAVPETILSRCAILTLESHFEASEDIREAVEEIAKGLTASSELMLLKALAALSSRQQALDILTLLRLVLVDALSLSVGSRALSEEQLSSPLAQKFTKSKIIRLIDVTSDAINKINRNVSLVLISTWLCGEYRRITWQM